MSDIVKTSLNNNAHKDLVISLKQNILLADNPAQLHLRYIPDKLLMDHAGFADYVKAHITPLNHAEETVHIILEEMVDTLVPRWIEVGLWCEENEQQIIITLFDKQPHWHNDLLLTRLPPLF